MKYVVIPNNLNEINSYANLNINTFIVGLKDFCINYPSMSIEDINLLCNKFDIFIAINKNIFNDEISNLLEKLKILEKMPIKGILFYDLGVLNLIIDNGLKLELVWHQTHMVTNYNTCNFYYEKGVSYGFISNEITLDEIIEINNNTNMSLFVEVFGYPIMSHSRRLLLSNYLKSIDMKKEDRIYHLSDKENSYLLKETNDGASILFGKLINGTRPLFELISNGINYCVLDMQEVDVSLGKKVVEMYNFILNNINTITEEDKENIILEMNKLIGDNTNFFYKKTIYKLKNEGNVNS